MTGYRVDIDCEPGSAVHITTQAAGNVFRARQNFATQLVNRHVGAGAVLEYPPDPIVPFPRIAAIPASLCVTVERDSTVILGEAPLPGRAAHHEARVYNLYWAETEVRGADGGVLFADVLRLNPVQGDDPRSIGPLGSHDVIATLDVVAGWRSRARSSGCCELPLPAAATCSSASASCQTGAARASGSSAPLEGGAGGARDGVERGPPGTARRTGA